MPRKPRIEYEGAVYHMMSCGDRGLSIFKDDTARKRFINALGEACERAPAWLIHTRTTAGH